MFAVLCLACGVLWAYTRGVQEATLFWGRRLGEGNELLPATGMQDAITPPGQNTRNTVMFASFLALPIVGVHQLGWAIGIGGLVGSFVASIIIWAVLPKPDSTFFFQIILRGLADRRAKFARASDELRLEATDAVLEKLKAAFEAHHFEQEAGDHRADAHPFPPQEVERIVNDYGAALEAAAATGSIVVDVSRLPAPKDHVKSAIFYALRLTSDKKMLQHLKTGFIDLVNFQAGVGEQTVGFGIESIPEADDTEALKALAQQVVNRSDDVKKWNAIVSAERDKLVQELREAGLW
jgi:hypothetical protein